MSRARGTADDGFVTAVAPEGSERRPESPLDATALRIIRLPEVERRTGLARSTIYAFMAEKRFPLSVSLSDTERGAVGWVESEVNDWLLERIRKSRQ